MPFAILAAIVDERPAALDARCYAGAADGFAILAEANTVLERRCQFIAPQKAHSVSDLSLAVLD